MYLAGDSSEAKSYKPLYIQDFKVKTKAKTA